MVNLVPGSGSYNNKVHQNLPQNKYSLLSYVHLRIVREHIKALTISTMYYTQITWATN